MLYLALLCAILLLYLCCTHIVNVALSPDFMVFVLVQVLVVCHWHCSRWAACFLYRGHVLHSKNNSWMTETQQHALLVYTSCEDMLCYIEFYLTLTRVLSPFIFINCKLNMWFTLKYIVAYILYYAYSRFLIIGLLNRSCCAISTTEPNVHMSRSISSLSTVYFISCHLIREKAPCV